jgi:hypothetical protein
MTFTAAFGGLVSVASIEILRASLSDALRMTGWMRGRITGRITVWTRGRMTGLCEGCGKDAWQGAKA